MNTHSNKLKAALASNVFLAVMEVVAWCNTANATVRRKSA